MTRVIGLVEVETGERGWVRYDTRTSPVKFWLWFASKDFDSKIRAYLRTPFMMVVKVRKPTIKHRLDEGMQQIEVNPTDSDATFRAALVQMQGAIGIRPEVQEAE